MAAPRSGGVRMDLAVAGVNHQPFVIGFVDQDFQQFFPNTRITPTDKTSVRIAPASILRRQISPWRACP
jgi:hypothetical protein